MDYLKNYAIPEEFEDYTVATGEDEDVIDPELQDEEAPQPKMRSNLRLPPPPLFSRQGIPQNYK